MANPKLLWLLLWPISRRASRRIRRLGAMRELLTLVPRRVRWRGQRSCSIGARKHFSCPVCLARKAAPAAKHQGVQLHLCSHEASGYKNVRAVPNRSTFYALGVRGSYLGSFPTAEAAAIAYAMHVEACSEKVGRMAHVAKPPAHTESPRQPPTEQVQPGRILFWAGHRLPRFPSRAWIGRHHSFS